MVISLRQNKYLKYQLLNRFRKLRRYLPDTKLKTNKAVTAFLEKYGDIILKPQGGKRGRGVIRVSTINNEVFEIHLGKVREIAEGKDQMLATVNRYIGDRRYLVQQRIPLCTIKGRPFDLRVIVQRKTKLHRWKVTGKACKVAGPGYIVTNIERSQGKVLPLKTALRKSSLKARSSRSIAKKIDKVALRGARTLANYYTEQHIFGFDMGLSKDSRVWIIEANLAPMLSHFKKLKNKKTLRRIRKFKNL